MHRCGQIRYRYKETHHVFCWTLRAYIIHTQTQSSESQAAANAMDTLWMMLHCKPCFDRWWFNVLGESWSFNQQLLIRAYTTFESNGFLQFRNITLYSHLSAPGSRPASTILAYLSTPFTHDDVCKRRASVVCACHLRINRSSASVCTCAGRLSCVKHYTHTKTTHARAQLKSKKNAQHTGIARVLA